MTLTEFFNEIARNASFEMEVRKYSGRFMYNNDCIGITTDNIGKVMAAALMVISDNGLDDDMPVTDLIKFFNELRQDNMGMSSIFYSPRCDFEGDEDEEEDED